MKKSTLNIFVEGCAFLVRRLSIFVVLISSISFYYFIILISKSGFSKSIIFNLISVFPFATMFVSAIAHSISGQILKKNCGNDSSWVEFKSGRISSVLESKSYKRMNMSWIIPTYVFCELLMVMSGGAMLGALAVIYFNFKDISGN
jgi:hypothetical protein